MVNTQCGTLIQTPQTNQRSDHVKMCQLRYVANLLIRKLEIYTILQTTLSLTISMKNTNSSDTKPWRAKYGIQVIQYAPNIENLRLFKQSKAWV